MADESSMRLRYEITRQHSNRAWVVGSLLIVAAAIATRLLLLLQRPLWFDELFTLLAARLRLKELLTILKLDSGPPLFYLLEKPFATATSSIVALRVLLRLPSFAATLALLAFGASLKHFRQRALFLALAASHPLLNLYSAEARAYALVGLLGFLVFELALEGAATPGRLCLLALLTTAALFTHYLALFLVGTVLLLALRQRPRCAAAIAIGALPFLLWLPTLLGQPAEALRWMREAPISTATGFLSSLGGVGRVAPSFGASPPLWLVAFGAILGLALLAMTIARARHLPMVREGFLCVAAILGTALIVSLWKPIAFAGRTEMAILPIGIATFARAGKEDPFLRGVLAVSAAAGLLATAATAFSPHATPLVNRVSGDVERAAHPDDLIVAAGPFYLPSRVVSNLAGTGGRLRAYPEELASHPGWFSEELPSSDEESRLEEVLSAGSHRQVFLLLTRTFAGGRLGSFLSSRGSSSVLFQTPQLVVLVWKRNDSQGTPSRS